MFSVLKISRQKLVLLFLCRSVRVLLGRLTLCEHLLTHETFMTEQIVRGFFSNHHNISIKSNVVAIYNQRTNGPVNAHLISGPTVSTKISFAKFVIVLK